MRKSSEKFFSNQPTKHTPSGHGHPSSVVNIITVEKRNLKLNLTHRSFIDCTSICLNQQSVFSVRISTINGLPLPSILASISSRPEAWKNSSHLPAQQHSRGKLSTD
jgi:hypothetical protein